MAGERSQAEDFEEEQDDRQYSFRHYHGALTHAPSDRVQYRIGIYLFRKDYTADDGSDSRTRLLDAKGRYRLSRNGPGFSRIDVKLKYKEKRFTDNPSGDYEQIFFSPLLTVRQKDRYAVTVAGGLNHYDYRKAEKSDQLKLFVRFGLRRTMLGGKLLLSVADRLEVTSQRLINRRKNKHDLSLRADLKISRSYAEKVSAGLKAGYGDTKDDDGRDEDFDYRYGTLFLSSVHRISKVLNSRLKVQYFEKDYLTGDLDHNGYSILNSWKSTFPAGVSRVFSVRVTAIHKEVNYTVKNERDYTKDTLGVTGALREKKRWKASCSFDWNGYNFTGPDKDRTRYIAKLFLEKYFLLRALIVSVTLKYKYTDNRKAIDEAEQSVRIAVTRRFSR